MTFDSLVGEKNSFPWLARESEHLLILVLADRSTCRTTLNMSLRSLGTYLPYSSNRDIQFSHSLRIFILSAPDLLSEFAIVEKLIYPAPLIPWGPENQAKINRLTTNVWLSKKVCRSRRWDQHVKWFAEHLPELLRSVNGTFVDIGPGPGESLEIATICGHKSFGYDAVSGNGGMGQRYFEYCDLMHMRQRLDVRRVPLREMFDSVAGVDFVMSRGSIEQVFSDFMIGQPHHEHHNAKAMKWDIKNAYLAMESLLIKISNSMNVGGIFVVHANGSSADEGYAEMLKAAAKKVGFSVTQNGNLKHRMTKT